MGCNYPRYAWYGPRNPETGKLKPVFHEEASTMLGSFELPCGKCAGCKAQYRQDWSTRCYCEAKARETSCMINLTYKTNHFPGGKPHVSKEDIRGFIKRLRRAVDRRKPGTRISYLVVSEYGPKTGRPHYHGIIFGWEFPDIELDPEPTQKGNRMFKSELCERIWKKGRCRIGTADTGEAAKYCMDYLGKESSQWIGVDGRPDQFKMQSTCPAIGRTYYERWGKDIYPDDFIVIDGIKTPVPRVFDKWYEEDDPEGYARIKRKRNAEAIRRADRENRPERRKAREVIMKQKAERKVRNE